MREQADGMDSIVRLIDLVAPESIHACYQKESARDCLTDRVSFESANGQESIFQQKLLTDNRVDKSSG